MSGDEVSEGAEVEGGAGQEPAAQIEPQELEAEQDLASLEGELEPELDQRGAEGASTSDNLAQQLEQALTQAEEYLDGWQRARADFANYKKRVVREQEEAQARIAGETISRYLGVVDDLERALRDRPADKDAVAWAEGIELIYRKMLALLESDGVQPIQAEGDEFDPNLHEALSHEESRDHDAGQVIEVIQPGYRMGDRILRPALVRVAK